MNEQEETIQLKEQIKKMENRIRQLKYQARLKKIGKTFPNKLVLPIEIHFETRVKPFRSYKEKVTKINLGSSFIDNRTTAYIKSVYPMFLCLPQIYVEGKIATLKGKIIIEAIE